MTAKTPIAEDCPTHDIPDDNPFYGTIVDMASDDVSWLKIYWELEEALDAVDPKANEELTKKYHDPDTSNTQGTGVDNAE